MTLGIVGLGLIGGSFAKAYKNAHWRVLAQDVDTSMVAFAQMCGTVDDLLTAKNMAECDLILVCIYPQAAIAWMEEHAAGIGAKPVVIDCCGTKRQVCQTCFPLAEAHGLTYLGGHPMAGTHNSGFKYAKADMFRGAPMVIVPPSFDDIALLQRVKDLLAPAGFGSISVTNAADHDRMISFTSQLAHVVSNAYIKSPTAGSHKGFSAGSYKDMTRVAWLNPQMWAELFLENKDYLLEELDILSRSLDQYKAALQDGEKETLIRLLDEGRKRKEEVDGH